jgi:hypothetical protein
MNNNDKLNGYSEFFDAIEKFFQEQIDGIKEARQEIEYIHHTQQAPQLTASQYAVLKFNSMCELFCNYIENNKEVYPLLYKELESESEKTFYNYNSFCFDKRMLLYKEFEEKKAKNEVER